MKNIVDEIVERRLKDISNRGIAFGFDVPEKRNRPVNDFMGEKGMILEIKRASPSKGDISPNLDAVATGLEYRKHGAKAISCLTEENYFKGSLKDLIELCNAVQDVAVLRKDFLVMEDEIDVSYRCGADAVLLIARILDEDKLISMTKRCYDLGIKAFVEVRTLADAEKVLKVKELYSETVVCGVNSRNLKDFSMDALVPGMFLKKLGGRVIYESGVSTEAAVHKIASMGFSGILLGEFAARNPEGAGRFTKEFARTVSEMNVAQETQSEYGRSVLKLAEMVGGKKDVPLVKICGLTRKEDVLLAEELGSDVLGFIFADGFSRNVCGEKFDLIKDCLASVKALKVAVVTDLNSREADVARQYVKDGVLDFIQIHGVSFSEVPAEFFEVPHYFAITEKNASDVNSLEESGEARFIQDIKNQTYSESGHLWMAGCITPDNVNELIKKYNPELIDVSSGIEIKGNAGIKDASLLKKLFENIGR